MRSFGRPYCEFGVFQVSWRFSLSTSINPVEALREGKRECVLVRRAYAFAAGKRLADLPVEWLVERGF
ncbi:hypothetical protein AKJ16_DCAP04197 [Drosera capensis]